MSFQDNLKKYREQAGFKQAKEFAQFLDIPYTSYMAYENKGSFPNEKTLLKIANALHVSIDDLLGRDEMSKDELQKAKAFFLNCGYDIVPSIIGAPQIGVSEGYAIFDPAIADSYLFLIRNDADLIQVFRATIDSTNYKEEIKRAQKNALKDELLKYDVRHMAEKMKINK